MKKNNKQSKKPSINSEVIEDYGSKTIVISTEHKDLDVNKCNFIISIDGTINKALLPNDKHIEICLTGSNITWTQLKVMADLIKELRLKGAGSIKRYDELYLGSDNPKINLAHALIKYGIKN